MDKFGEYLYLADMYRDDYYPRFLVDKVKAVIVEIVKYLELGKHDIHEIQEKFDSMTDTINELTEEFYENGSEFETVARESVGETIDRILRHFNIDIDVETAIRNRDW